MSYILNEDLPELYYIIHDENYIPYLISNLQISKAGVITVIPSEEEEEEEEEEDLVDPGS